MAGARVNMDFWNPNTWGEFPQTCRVYDPDGERFAIVDAIYFPLLARHKWNIRPDLYTAGYFRRAAGNGPHNGGTGVYTVYLHLEVVRLAELRPPSRRHTIVDHIDRDTFNCIQANLRWVTPRQNAENRLFRPARPRD